MRIPRVTIGRLMIVVAMCAFVIAAAVFVEKTRREVQARALCTNNLKQLTLALHQYHNWNDCFPAGTFVNPKLPAPRRLSWFTVIVNTLEQGARLQLDWSKSWDSGENLPPKFLIYHPEDVRPPYTVSANEISFLRCPAHPPPPLLTGPIASDYVGIGGLGVDSPTLPLSHPRAGVFGYDRTTRISDIKDGISTTMMIAETAEARGPWTAGGTASVRGLDPSRQPYIGKNRQFGGIHRGGGMVAFADGSVRFIRDSVDPKVFEAISTIAGGEPAPD